MLKDNVPPIVICRDAKGEVQGYIGRAVKLVPEVCYSNVLTARSLPVWMRGSVASRQVLWPPQRVKT